MEHILKTIFSSNVFADISNIALLIGLVIALIQCFFGYKIIRSWIAIIGFLLGAVAGYGIVFSVTDELTYGLIAGVIGGILLGFLAYKVYLFGVFALALLGTYYLCTSFFGSLHPLSFVIAILVAILAVKYMRPAIIFVTAFTGAFAALEAAPAFISYDVTLTIPIGVVIALIGAAVQFATTKKEG